MDNLLLKVENIVVKGEIASFEQFLLLSLCFQKSCVLQRRQKASIPVKGLREFPYYYSLFTFKALIRDDSFEYSQHH